MEEERKIHDWEKLYREQEFEDLPWFCPFLDPDLERALSDYRLKSGKVLDLGTGSGTQAIALAEKGYEVTGSDISSVAVQKASRNAKQKGLRVEFVQDDILNGTVQRF